MLCLVDNSPCITLAQQLHEQLHELSNKFRNSLLSSALKPAKQPKTTRAAQRIPGFFAQLLPESSFFKSFLISLLPDSYISREMWGMIEEIESVKEIML